MAVGTFRVGQRLCLGGEAYRVSRDLGEGLVVLESLQSGSYRERSIADLLADWRMGDLHFVSVNRSTAAMPPINTIYEDVFRQSYSKEAQAEAMAKLAYVRRLGSHPRTKSIMVPIIKDIWSDKKLWKDTYQFSDPPHFTTVARWIRAYGDSGNDMRSLVNRHSDKGLGIERVDPVIRKMVEDAIELEYLTLERPPLMEVWRKLKGQVALRNATRLPSEALTRPSYNYLKNQVGGINPYDVYRARYGQRVADIKFRAAGSGLPSRHPLARASMDHTKFDLFVVDEKNFLPLGRPWLTLVLDENSRYVLGYSIGFEEPSSVSMSRALCHAIAPKELDSEVRNTWDAWGVMDYLIVDQGREFHGRILEGGASRYGITVQYCPRLKPWFKGKIERYFGTLNTGLLSKLKGKTFSSIDLRGDYDPAKHAVITLETLRRIVQIWIVDVYHQDKHGALGTSPQQAWEEGMRSGSEGGNPVDRYLPPSSIEVNSAFSASYNRRLTHKGISFDSLLYNSAELGELRCLWGAEVEVQIRVQDEDLGSIVVVSPDGHTLIKVPALDQEYAANLTRWQHSVCKRFKRIAQEDDGREISLLDAKNRISALIEADILSGGRGARSKVRQQRFSEQPASSEQNRQGEKGSTPSFAAGTSSIQTVDPPSCPALPALAPPIAQEIDSEKAAPVQEECFEDDDIPTFKSTKRQIKEAA